MKSRQAVIVVFSTVVLAIGMLFCTNMPAWGAETITVGIPKDRCPIFYADSNTGEATGIGVDLMRAVSEDAGYDAQFVFVEEPTLKDALDNEKYDVVMPFGSAIKSASGQSIIVSDNLLQTPFTLVIAGNQSLPDLNKLRVGMLKSLGGGAETVKELYPGIEIVFYDTMEESVSALRAGKIDALLHNSYVWSYVLQKPSYADLSVQPTTMFSMDFRVGALDTQERQAIIDRLDDSIAHLSDTKRQAIILDHTSRHLYQYDVSDYIHLYGFIICLCVLLVAALIAIVVMKRRTFYLEQEEKMRKLVDQDPLTGTLTLSGFRKQAEELIRQNPDTSYLLMYANIKNFKFVNDSFGRTSGDELLQFFANKINEVLSEKETVGRVESDRFAILRCAGENEKLIEKNQYVTDAVCDYYINQGYENKVQLCAGIYVLMPQDYKKPNIDHMLDCARIAEQRSRKSGEDRYEFYNPDQWEKAKRGAEITSHFPVAIQSKELEVWYQPQIDYRTHSIIGAEALCRWNHPQLGWISPTEFIPVLEEAGLVYDLDCYVWEQVCKDVHRWKEQGVHQFVSMNLSRDDVRKSPSITKHFNDLIEKYELKPEQLSIEITESAYVKDSAVLIDITNELQDCGFTVEMDDFGSGYSSLHMLKKVPVNRIKLDLHFLDGDGDPERERIIISQMIQMVNLMDMRLIAEGVETEEQAMFLNEQGCFEMQGFNFYKPMPAYDFEKLIIQ